MATAPSPGAEEMAADYLTRVERMDPHVAV
jgi:hypothetical protein